jgi:hypothetical protein
MIIKVNPTKTDTPKENETTEHYVGSRKENVKKMGSPLAPKKSYIPATRKGNCLLSEIDRYFRPGAR